VGNPSIVLAVNTQDERETLTTLLESMGIKVYHAYSGLETVHHIEDYHCEGVISDIQLSDMQVWVLINKIAEIKPNPNVSFIVMSNDNVVTPASNTKVVVRPVSLASLKQIISAWQIERA
jgi:CheY-like chemotaxis protein